MPLPRIYRGFALAAASLIGSSFPYLCSAQHRIELPKSTPLRFELNQGQLPAGSKFLARLQGYQVYLTPSGAEFHFPSLDSVDTNRSLSGGVSRVLHFDLVNEERSARIAGAERLPGITNYFAGKDPAQWHTGIPSYARVLYRSIYPGIDLVAFSGMSGI